MRWHISIWEVRIHEKGLSDDAIAAYRQAIPVESDYPEAWLRLGNVLADQRRLDEAAFSYNKALALRPDYPAARQKPQPAPGRNGKAG